MKNTASRISVLFFAALCAAGCAFAALQFPKAAPVPVSGNTFAPERYTVSVYEGKVAVYDAALPGRPESVTSISVSGLRASDREALSNGIPADTFEETLKILEDLNS